MKDIKKIYVAGAGGMLGEAIFNVFNNDYDLMCSDIKNISNDDWISFLDFRDLQKYEEDVSNFKANYLFHIGAYTDLEYCETNVEDTYRTNTLSVENAVYISNKLNIPIIYISTAGIFDGNKNIYDDWDTPNPIGTYARSKYIGENIVELMANKYIIVRAGWMMGGGPNKDKKFIQKIMHQLKNKKNELYIVNDKLGTPTYTNDFANNLKLILQKELWGKYNLVCEGLTSRLEVANEIIKLLNLENKIKIVEVDSNYWKEKYFAPRPYCERLVNTKLNLRNINIMRNWRICLKEYLDISYKNYI